MFSARTDPAVAVRVPGEDGGEETAMTCRSVSTGGTVLAHAERMFGTVVISVL